MLIKSLLCVRMKQSNSYRLSIPSEQHYCKQSIIAVFILLAGEAAHRMIQLFA